MNDLTYITGGRREELMEIAKAICKDGWKIISITDKSDGSWPFTFTRTTIYFIKTNKKKK
jgi:DNA-binding MurR/RpiR family transcriptional regulator